MTECGAAPLPSAFVEPWHAQVFAVTVHLNAAGVFSWPEWAERFGARLQQHGLHKELDGGDDYYGVWLETLENLLAAQGIAPLAEVAALKTAWEQAYLSTPHGAPVRLGGE